MKCTLSTETLEFEGLKVPNSRLALRGLAPPCFAVCKPFLPLIHGLCASFRPLLTPASTAPFFDNLSAHGLQLTVCAPSNHDQPFRVQSNFAFTFSVLSSIKLMGSSCTPLTRKIVLMSNCLRWPSQFYKPRGDLDSNRGVLVIGF